MTCQPDVTANATPTLKRKVTFFDDVGYPVAVRIDCSRVGHRAGALISARCVRRAFVVVHAIASNVPEAIDGACLWRVIIGFAAVTSFA